MKKKPRLTLPKLDLLVDLLATECGRLDFNRIRTADEERRFRTAQDALLWAVSERGKRKRKV